MKMKKLYFLVILFLCGLSVGNVCASASAAAVAPRGLEMTDDDNNNDNNKTLSDRIKAGVNDYPRHIGNAAVWGADQTCCCGCYEGLMKDYLLSRRIIKRDNKYYFEDDSLFGCLCTAPCSRKAEAECGLAPCLVACGVAVCMANWIPEFPSECASAAVGFGSVALALLSRRYEKVKADMKREKGE